MQTERSSEPLKLLMMSFFLTCLAVSSLAMAAPDSLKEGPGKIGGANTIGNLMAESTISYAQEIPEGKIIQHLLSKIQNDFPEGYMVGLKKKPAAACTSDTEIQKALENNVGVDQRGGQVTNYAAFFSVDSLPIHTTHLLMQKEKELEDFRRCLQGRLLFILLANQKALPFYFTQNDLKTLEKEKLGIPFDTEQTAIQTNAAVFANNMKYNAMDDMNKKMFFTHEILLFNLKHRLNGYLALRIPDLTDDDRSTIVHDEVRYITSILIRYADGRYTKEDFIEALEDRNETDSYFKSLVNAFR